MIKSFLKKNMKIIITILLLLILSIVFYLYRHELHRFFSMLTNKKKLRRFLLSFGPFGVIIFVLLQVLQVVIFFIPGEVVQTVGGYTYGTIPATLLSIIGITIGTFMLFIPTRIYGKKFVEKFVPMPILKPFEKLLQTDKLNLVVFLIYFLPGIPKDSNIFLCALSPISFTDFLIYSTLGRIPNIIITSYYGANIAHGNKTIFIILTILILAICLVGALKKDEFFKLVSKYKKAN